MIDTYRGEMLDVLNLYSANFTPADDEDEVESFKIYA